MDSKLQVLVLEDEWLIAESLAAGLVEQGFEIIGPACRVSEALALLETRTVDVAVLDVSLGDETSFPVADKLHHRGISFVFVTGYGSGDLPERFKGRPILAKPLDFPGLLGALSELMTCRNVEVH
jgi:DNA-binding response OmpR family regulator